jgi:hypothetical protein
VAENAVDDAILAALAERQELAGPLLRERAGLTSDEFYAAILQLESDRRVRSRWAEGVSPMVRLYRLADVEIDRKS